jgi:hypothetical protein
MLNRFLVLLVCLMACCCWRTVFRCCADETQEYTGVEGVLSKELNLEHRKLILKKFSRQRQSSAIFSYIGALKELKS